MLEDAGGYRTFETFISYWAGAVTMDRSDYRNFPLAAWGTYLSVSGFLFSYGYDLTLGKLAAWVRHGK